MDKGMKQTNWVEFNDGRSRIRAEYGLHRIGNQDPYFSVTADVDERNGPRFGWRNAAGGCMHELVAEHFPKLAPFIKWHLATEFGPMHYIANGLYWWEAATGSRVQDKKYDYPLPGKTWKETAMEHFKSTIVYGALPNENSKSLELLALRSHKELEKWLEGRLLKLVTAFREDMEKMAKLQFPK